MSDRPTENYSIKEMIQLIYQDIQEIKKEARATNGRLRTLERWQSTIKGAIGILTVLVLPILIEMVINWAKN